MRMSQLSMSSLRRPSLLAMTITAHLCSSHGGRSPAADLCTWLSGTHIETGRSSRQRRRGASGRSLGSPGCSLCLCLGQLSRTWGRERSKRYLKNSSWAEDSLLHRNPEQSENRFPRNTATLCSHLTETASQSLSKV